MHNILNANENIHRRQGDCMIFKVDSEIDKTLPSRKSNTLAVGEGHHAHMFPQELEFFKGKLDTGNEMVEAEFFEVPEHMELEHKSLKANEKGEHKSIPLEKGTYAYVKERQFDPFDQQVRQVQD